jgi:hypothetical protein
MLDVGLNFLPIAGFRIHWQKVAILTVAGLNVAGLNVAGLTYIADRTAAN